MSKQIDERVVEMTFDNKDFEKNVATSMSTIDKLKAALNFRGAEKGLDAVNSAAKKVNLSGVSNAVDKVRVKFDALQVAGITALANITNSAINTGKRMASAFTVDPIVQGFNEYETQLNSVQTIMANTASKGTTIDQVTDALNELNTYADKTIYNFTEMTRNIGTFTAAGVDLDKSVASIKGIANLAAMSGSSSIQASTAMYQLSQAIAAGRVSLMDWNSVVNAGMGGEQFQEALKRTARVMGTGVDAVIEKYGSFRESLTKGQWLTTDVLTETLKQISGAYSEAELMQQGYSQEQAKAIANMAVTAEEAATKVKTFTQMIDTMKEAVGSGWAQTWQTVFGDFYEARDFWTSISDMFGDMIGNMSDARNTLLEGAFESSWEQIRGKIEATGGSLDLFDEKIREVVNEAGINYDDLISKTGDLSTAIQDGAINMEAVQEAFIRFAIASGDVNKNLPEIEASFNSFSNTVKDIWRYGFDDSAEKIEELTRAGYDYAEVSDLVQKITEGQELAVSDLTEAQLKAIGVTDEQMTSLGDLFLQLDDTNSGFKALFKTLSQDSGRVLFLDSIRNLLDAIIKPLQAFSKAWHNVFSIDSGTLYSLLEGFNHFTESLIISQETSDKLTRTFEGLFSILSIFTNFVGGSFSAVFQIIQTVLDHFDLGILDVTAGIGDMLTSFADFVNSHNIFTAAIQVIANAIIWAITSIQDFVDMVKESEIVAVIASNISEAFNGIRDAVMRIAGGAIAGFHEFVDLIMSLRYMSFDEIIKAFQDFGSRVWDSIVSAFTQISEPIDKAISNIVTAANEKFGWLIDILINVKNVVAEVVSNIIERFSGTGLAGVFAIIFSAGTLALISKFINIFSKLASPIEAAIGLIDSLKTSFEKYAKAKAFTEMTEGIRNIAISIGIMAAAVVALGQLQPDQLMNASIAVGALAVALIAITGALTFLTSKGGFGKLGVGIAAIGAGILMVATSFRVLEGIDEKSMESSLHAIVSVMIVMTTLALALQKFGGKGDAKEFGGPALQIIALAAAVAIVANAVKSMAEIDQASMTTAIFGMITVFGALTGLMAIMNRFGGGLKNASGLLVMVIGLQAFLLVVGQLANFDASGIIANLPNILVLFGMIAALMAASSLAGANSAKGGLGLIGISASMLIITQVINILGSMDAGVLQRGTAAVVAIGTIMSLLIAATHLAGDNSLKAGGSLILISTAAMILTGAIAILGSMDPGTLARGLTAITIIGTIFAGLIAVTHLAKDCAKELIVMTVAIGILVGAVVLLSALDPAKVVPATACLTALMMAFGGMAALTKFTGKANSGMIAALGVIVVLAGVVALLGGLNMEGAIAASASITILMIGMSAALLAMGHVGDVSPTAMAAMGILTLVVAALAVILGALTALDVAPSIETSASISIMLLGMTAVLAALSAIGPTANLALSALGPLLAVIGVLGAVFTALGGLNNLLGGGVSDAIAGAIPIMENIGKAIGSFVGGIIGGVASGAMSALPQIASSINAFWMGIQPFIIGMKVMGPEALSGVKTLVEMMLMITAADFIEGITHMFGGSSMDNFAVNIVKFGAAISAFSAILSAGNFNGETVTAAANAGKALAEMQNTMQGSGGLFQMFEGTKDMGAFGEQLKAFGSAIVEFSKVVSAEGAINSDAITNAANAGKVMAELQKSLAQNGDGFSVVKFFAGEQNLETFGEQIVAFGEAMVDFSAAVSKDGAINSDAVNNAANAGKIMAELQKSIGTNTTSVFSLFAGEQNLEHFGTQIKMFGEGIVAFSNAITENGGIDTDAITKAQTAGIAMAELANSLPDYAFGSGKLDLTGFGYDLIDYAGSIVGMSNQLSGVDMTKISLATTIAQRVTDVITTLQGVDESVINKFWVLDDLATSLSGFATSVVGIDTTSISTAAVAAQRLVDLIASMTGINADSIAGFSSAISALGQVSYDQIYSSFSSVDFSLIGVNVMTRLAQGIQVGAQNVQAQLGIILSSLGNYASQGTQEFNLAGLRLATEFATGIQNGAANVQTQVTIMVQNAANALNGYEGFFYAAGSNLAVGFANGIGASSYRATLAARAMANAAKTAAEEALDEHSPSKVMEKIGDFAGQGFINGLVAYEDPSYDAGMTIANAAVNGISTLTGIYDSFGDLEATFKEITALSEKLNTAKKKDKETTKEETENTSKLSDALKNTADNLQSLIDRKNDLKALDKILTDTGATLSEGFIAELLSSEGQYAGALTEMVDLTDEQMQKLSDIFDQADFAEKMEDVTNTISDGIAEMSDRVANINAVQKILSNADFDFSDAFISELLSSSGEYADTAAAIAELSAEQINEIAKLYDRNQAIDKMQTAVDALADTMTDLSSKKSELRAVDKVFKRLGVTLDKRFKEELMDTSGAFAGVVEGISELSDEMLQKLNDTFMENEIFDQVQEFISILSEDAGLAAAFESSGESVEDFVTKIVNAGEDVSDVAGKIQDFADTVSDGFSKMEIKDQTGLAEFTDNLNNNLIMADEWADNIETVFSKIGNYPFADQFREEILEGGFDKYGKIISELATSSIEQIIDFIELWNTANNYGSQLGANVLSVISPTQEQIEYAGESIAEGFAQGVTSKTSSAINAATFMCQSVENGIESFFRMSSTPSKLTEELGRNLVAGFVAGLNSGSDALKKSFAHVKKAVEYLMLIGEQGIDIQVRVTPVLDMADFNAKLSALQSDYASTVPSDVLNRIDSVGASIGQNGVTSSTAKLSDAVKTLSNKIDSIDPNNFGVTYQQNNYSPKALSTATIYRQTKNQISLARNKNGKSFKQ